MGDLGDATKVLEEAFNRAHLQILKGKVRAQFPFLYILFLCEHRKTFGRRELHHCKSFSSILSFVNAFFVDVVVLLLRLNKMINEQKRVSGN